MEKGNLCKTSQSALVNLGHEVDVISGPPYPELDNSVNLIKVPSLNLFELQDNQRLTSFRMRFLKNSADLIEWAGVLNGRVS
ncbi:MAG: hypothetical protein CM1200mP12_21200 [Gammaproteobacteria bacterium]|nr:MAG: hypothetical protein CM1200mP12_21200 [Gammaproteobacteria bacterium]